MKLFFTAILLFSWTFLTAGKNMELPQIEIDTALLKRHVETLVNSPEPPNWNHPEGLASVSDYIHNQFMEIGLAPEFQTFTVASSQYRNVIGILNPSSNRLVVIGAHYDVHGDLPGADDNASGIAGLIELTRVLKQYESQLPCQIRFVAFANEEPPFFGTDNMGSYIHAKSLHDQDEKVDYMIALEMIGYFTEAPKSQTYPVSLLNLFYPSTGNFIAVVSRYGIGSVRKSVRNSMNKYSNIKCRSLSAPASLTGIDFSDHRNYWRFGYRAVMITDTSFYRNRNYHTDADTIDTLDFEKMREVVRGLALHFIMAGLADGAVSTP